MIRSLLPVVCAAGAMLLLAGCGPEQQTAAPSPAAAPVDLATVTNVIDGDTFTVADGRTVRVLGVDSCEMDTTAGQEARSVAVTRLQGMPVTLAPEPGSDRDPYDRVLRYVRLPDGQDFGKSMVMAPHTAVYEGGGASPVYVSEVRALDVDGRTCVAPPPAPTTTSEPPPPVVVQDDDDDRPYVPAPADDDSRSGRSGSSSSGSSESDGDGGSATKPRSGQSGHPCLPGERDGDDDGYCGEGR